MRLQRASLLNRISSIFFCARLCTSRSLNLTIDDQSGDIVTGRLPVYFPLDERWSQGSSCPTCTIRPGLVDTQEVFDGTWHDCTYHHGDPGPAQVQLTFTGTAVYVYNLLANRIPSATTLTNLSFLLDGEFVGKFVHEPEESPNQILYDRLVYFNDTLSHTEHNLIMEATGSQSSLILFDYATYTTDDDTLPPSPSTSPISTSETSQASVLTGSAKSSAPSRSRTSSIVVGVIVGTIVGVLAALLTLAIVFFLLRRRSRFSSSTSLSSLRRNTVKQTGHPASTPSDHPSCPTDDSTSASSLLPQSPEPSSRASSLLPTSPESSSRTTSLTVPSSSHNPSPLNLDEEMGGQSRDRAVSFASPPLLTRWSWGRLHGSPPLVTPPRHGVDVPAPAISATGTEHSLRLAELTQDIRTLERAIRELDGNSQGSLESLPSHGQVSFRVLKERVARLRGQLLKEKRLMEEALPTRKKVVNV